jgi:hypothetical protein
VNAGDRIPGPAPIAHRDPSPDRTAATRTVPAPPVRVAAAGLAVAAARRAPAAIPQAVPRARPSAVPPTTPVRAPDPPPVPATPPPGVVAARGSRVREFIRQLNLIQVVCWQIAVVTVVLAVRQPWPALVGASVGAAALIALTAVRVNGHWLYALGALAAGYLSRSRRRDLPADAGKTPALLDLLVPGCAVRITGTGQGPAMTASHRGGLTVLLGPRGGATDLVDLLPMPAALLPAVDGQPCAFACRWCATPGSGGTARHGCGWRCTPPAASRHPATRS